MPGYAVIDFQTTGLDPARHDRVVEIGVVILDEHGCTASAWDTLVNPERDIGETERHGITARDVHDAPLFRDVAPELLEALDGRLVVAHNTRFDMLFLNAELERAGYHLRQDPLLALCTMELAATFLPGSRRSLESCCEKAGVELIQHFCSRAHAHATSELLRWYLERAGTPPEWEALYDEGVRYTWPVWQAGDVVFKPRADVKPTEPGAWLDRIVDRMPPDGDPDVDAYLAGLDMALLDKYLSAREESSLVALAAQLGIGRAQLGEIHMRYLGAMAAVALADGVVTEDERADLEMVAGLLGLRPEDVGAALANAEPATDGLDRTNGAGASLQFALTEGDQIALTGSMQTPRDVLVSMAASHGLIVGNLTRSTRLLVAADPDTSSGKGQKAASYGVPVVHEVAFLAMLDGLHRR